MTERGLTFIDVDENRLELWLKDDRVQLVVIDSRPELEAGELRRFASILFAEYVERDLSARLDTARLRLQGARDRAAGGDPAGGAVDALHAIDDLATALTLPDLDPGPLIEAAADRDVALGPEREEMPATDASPGPPVRELTGRRPYRLLKHAARGKRAGERRSPGGYRAVPDSERAGREAALGSDCH
jgi:hypothetical protein